MSTVNNNTAANQADLFARVGSGAQKTAAKTSSAEIEDRFLTLLMAQIKSQDPLNPMENAELTSQLAQLNTVNGIEKLNGTLSQLLNGYNETQGMQAAQVIGKNVMVAGNKLPLGTEGGVVGGITLAGNADRVSVTIKDDKGAVVQRQELGEHKAGNFFFSWDGKDADGVAFPPGNYTFAVEASAGGKAIDASTSQIGMVSAVVREKNGFLLDLGSMGQFAFKDVQQIL